MAGASPTGVRMTPKQLLRHHIAEDHADRMPVHYRTYEAMSAWHQIEHWRYSPNHYHQGPNTGPGGRPPGWKTGEGAVRRR